MSAWTSLRDKLVALLVGYGVSKAVDKNTSWVETREQLKVTAAEEAINQVTKKK